MAAFSQIHHPFLLDSSVFLQNTPIKMYRFVDEGNSNSNITINTNTNINTNTTFFSPYYTSDRHQETPVDVVGIHESRSCLLENSSSKAVYSDDNETSLTKKLISTDDSSSMVDHKLESGGEQQVTQKLMTSTTMDNKKRKNRDGSSLTSAQSSKDAREGKGRKQRKCSNGGGQSSDVVVEVKNTKLGGGKKQDQKNVGEEAPSGYIHVRARRGQATDSHSLAERVRREKISERMKLLQALVPGCDKVTGKALMLDEIINYVQSLQNQVEFLSMKLASLNPMIYDFGVDTDAFMVRTERLSGLASPLPSSVQQCSPTQTTAIADNTTTTTTTTFTTPPTNHYSLLDPSSFLLQQGHRLNPFITQDNGSLLWDVDGHKQKFINQSGLISNNMCSFH